jgi:hypothetical protein
VSTGNADVEHCPSTPVALSKHTTVLRWLALVRNGMVTAPLDCTCNNVLERLFTTKPPPGGVVTSMSAACAAGTASASINSAARREGSVMAGSCREWCGGAWRA